MTGDLTMPLASTHMGHLRAAHLVRQLTVLQANSHNLQLCIITYTQSHILNFQGHFEVHSI